MRKLGVMTAAAAAFIVGFGWGPSAKAEFDFPFDGALVGYWHFDTNTDPDDAVDESGNLNNGILNGGAARSTDIPNISGNTNSIMLDGDGDNVEVGDAVALRVTGSLTLATWIKRNTLGETMDIVGKWNSGVNKRSYRFVLRSDNKLQMVISSTGTNTTLMRSYTNATLTDTSNWHHVAGVFDAAAGPPTTLALYIDGVPQGTTDEEAPQSSIDLNDSKVFIGDRDGANFEFNGKIDDVRIYNTALTAQEIAVLANPALWLADPSDAPPEIDIDMVHVSHDGTDLTCEIVVASGTTGLENKSSFRCHIDFHDEEFEDLVNLPTGCDSADLDTDIETDQGFRLGTNGVCTTSDITLTYRTGNGRRGGSCTGTGTEIGNGGCSIEEFDSGGVFGNFDCDGSAGPDATCVITIVADLDAIAAVRDAECDENECLTNKDGDTGEYGAYMFFDTQHKGDRDRAPNTIPPTTKPDDVTEAVVFTFMDPPPPL